MIFIDSPLDALTNKQRMVWGTGGARELNLRGEVDKVTLRPNPLPAASSNPSALSN